MQTTTNHAGTTRLAVDTGGTFTDLVVERPGADVRLYKRPTTPANPIDGVLDVLTAAADDLGVPLAGLLGEAELIYATTHAINAVLTGRTARTALLVTGGHRDILVFREGGRDKPFDHRREFPDPYVPRALTFEVPERIGARGEVVEPLDEDAVRRICATLAEQGVEAVAVCLLWSVVEPKHELRVGELLAEELPGVPVTLAHSLNPSLREYRRAASAVIDASLKPLMTRHIEELERRLRESGLRGPLPVVTSSGGLAHAEAIAEAPVHVINSGPSMAPLAGRSYAATDTSGETVIVMDTGGTSFDVSLVRRGEIPFTRESWIGEPYIGVMTGFPSVDVRSIGAGGGSIARVDAYGLLHVGPQSAGAVPGPACYGRGGTAPTVTDASLVLGHIDPAYFLGGEMTLDPDAAAAAIERDVARPLGLTVEQAAMAIRDVATQHMVDAIEEITIHQGIDPRQAVLAGGGGAAGLNAVSIGRRLGCERVLIPDVVATLSAGGALLSDMAFDARAADWRTTADFDAGAVNRLLDTLEARCAAFADGLQGALGSRVDLFVEARYARQIWELEVHLPVRRFSGQGDVDALRRGFDTLHREVFGVADPDSEVELLGWRAAVRCQIGSDALPRVAHTGAHAQRARRRRATFPDVGTVDAAVWDASALTVGRTYEGPAVVETPDTSVVIDAGATFELSERGSLVIAPHGAAAKESR
ncbi:hydantoinase/oxoprolinase family protein [Actinomadura viridis]|uniref:N-methylhydantoinase A n=1 Tax=Actinomadura viridis TaxID=58110 RepID=A0A931DCD3_9ACTN|nr:hydantoinase/oxoprolinase family protein [Actinomadura viridis]MBG6085993.1 N-methylhydantoinase A [Actinomadura viridis]